MNCMDSGGAKLTRTPAFTKATQIGDVTGARGAPGRNR
jgi:hypothetical protein